MPIKDMTNSFITIESVKETDHGSLNGLTFGIKDNIPVKGLRNTSGSRVFLDHVADIHSRIVQTILFNGGEIAGKTNMHELGIGATCTSSIMGPCRNPHNLERISGGSSGGSASAVASGMVDVGIGTDTGGSVRIPAALCGVIGYKPSNMYAKSDAEIPFSPIMETTGVITKEMTTMQWVVRDLFPNIEDMDWNPDRIRIGVLGTSTDNNFDLLKEKLSSMKSKIFVENVNIPLLESRGNEVRRVISARDGYDALKDKLQEDGCNFYPDVRAVLIIGSQVPDEKYRELISLRKEIIAQYNEIMFDFDAIICPTTTTTAPRIIDVLGHESSFRDDLVKNTELFNVVGAPSITVPSGTLNGLPTGVMISGGAGDDSKLLRVSETISRLIHS